MALGINFEWYRDQAGYQLVPAGVRDPRWPENQRFDPVVEYPGGFLDQGTRRLARYAGRPREGAPEASKANVSDAETPRFERIVPLGGQLVPYRPPPGLSWIFANKARTKEGLLAFVRHYGPLMLAGNKQGEDVRLGLSEAEQMYRLIKSSPQDRAFQLSRWGENGMLIGSCFVFLTVNPVTGTPQLNYGGQLSLRCALWLELSRDLASGQTPRECEFCGNLFNTGPGTTRQAGAKFCSDAHRIAFNSKNRKNKKIAPTTG